MQQIFNITGALSAAFVFGTTVWFFFIQAPALLKRMGRTKFVPVQMMATAVLVKALLVGTALMAAAAMASTGSVTSPLVLTALLAVFGALVNERVLIPGALAAGGRGHVQVRGKDKEASTATFAADGVGKETATLHRLVVLFVVVMLAGVVPHMLLLGSPGAASAKTQSTQTSLEVPVMHSAMTTR